MTGMLILPHGAVINILTAALELLVVHFCITNLTQKNSKKRVDGGAINCPPDFK